MSKIREQRIYRASGVGIVLNFILVIVKVVIGGVSGSVAVLTDAANNMTDVLSSVVTLVGTKLAQKKPDRQHPYGHGRIEYIAAILVGLIIFGVGIGAVIGNAPLILEPREAEYSVVSVVVIFTTVLAKLGFSGYAKKVGREVESKSLSATGVDAMFDALLTLGTLVGAGLKMGFRISVEGWIGVVIAGFIIKSAVEILKDSLEELIGKRADEAMTRKIRAAIKEIPEVEKVGELVLHDYGPTEMMGAVRIKVGEGMKMERFEEVAKEIKTKVLAEFDVKLIVGV